MYDLNSVLIAAILFVSMAVVIEVGYRVGRRSRAHGSEAAKVQVNTIQASLLGVLALLLGFTFSLALQRYDSRNAAVVDEANAIGTTWLRAELLPDTLRSDAQNVLRSYINLRIEAGAVSLANPGEREALLSKAMSDQNSLWRFARLAAEQDGRPVTSGLFIQSLNDMIDSFGRRDAALARHVHEIVLFLLFATFLMTGMIVGYAASLAGHRATFVTYIMVTLIVFLVFIIVDLDRPRRGLIAVDQSNLIALQATINVSHDVASPDTAIPTKSYDN